jgi:hypothetical protein
MWLNCYPCHGRGQFPNGMICAMCGGKGGAEIYWNDHWIFGAAGHQQINAARELADDWDSYAAKHTIQTHDKLFGHSYLSPFLEKLRANAGNN